MSASLKSYAWFLLAGTIVTGCSTYDVIPERFETRINKSLTFEQIQANPSRHKGEWIVLGGEVLSTKRARDKIQVEVLQLSLTEKQIPVSERTGSRGRFYAYDTTGKLRGQLDEGTPVTIIGEVTGTTTAKIGDAKEEVLNITIKDLTKWDKRTTGNWFNYGSGYYDGYFYHGARPYGM